MTGIAVRLQKVTARNNSEGKKLLPVTAGINDVKQLKSDQQESEERKYQLIN